MTRLAPKDMWTLVPKHLRRRRIPSKCTQFVSMSYYKMASQLPAGHNCDHLDSITSALTLSLQVKTVRSKTTEMVLFAHFFPGYVDQSFCAIGDIQGVHLGVVLLID